MFRAWGFGVALLAAVIVVQGDGKVGEFCVENKQDKPIRAYWSEERYDVAPPKRGRCWNVHFPARYTLKTDPDDIVIHSLTFNEDKRITIDKCSQTCGMNGVCGDGSCVCFNSATKGYWTGAKCDKCVEKYGGPNCLNFCNPNGILEPGEECDDGNQHDADGCSACTLDDVKEISEWSLGQVLAFLGALLCLIWFVWCSAPMRRTKTTRDGM